MKLGGFTTASDNTVLRRTVLHEFGHAIGCVHEQASPAANIPWNEAKVYEFYRQWWDDETIRSMCWNVIQETHIGLPILILSRSCNTRYREN